MYRSVNGTGMARALIEGHSVKGIAPLPRRRSNRMAIGAHLKLTDQRWRVALRYTIRERAGYGASRDLRALWLGLVQDGETARNPLAQRHAPGD
jgi:hypothetical protein